MENENDLVNLISSASVEIRQLLYKKVIEIEANKLIDSDFAYEIIFKTLGEALCIRILSSIIINDCHVKWKNIDDFPIDSYIENIKSECINQTAKLLKGREKI